MELVSRVRAAPPPPLQQPTLLLLFRTLYSHSATPTTVSSAPLDFSSKFPCLSAPLFPRATPITRAKKRRGEDSSSPPPPPSPLPLQLTFDQEEGDEGVADAENEQEESAAAGVDEEEELEDEIIDDFEEIIMDDSEDFVNDFEEEEASLLVGDGGAGGGISLAGSWWDKEAFSIAENISMAFDGQLKIYAFKTSANLTIRIRIENLSTKYGSPSMDDIEAFSTAYRSRLDEAELAGRIPENITLEVSSPGLERVVRIPEELERFKDRPMYVKYVSTSTATVSPQESDGVFKLISYDMELGQCTWGLADVKVNRQRAGKGRPLSKKRKDWRLHIPFESVHLVRLHCDF